MKSFRSSKRRVLDRRTKTIPIRSRRISTKRRRFSNIARARIDRSLSSRRTRIAADGIGRLERRHEPRRRRRQRRKRLARLVSDQRRSRIFADLQRARRDVNAREDIATHVDELENRTRRKRLGRRLVSPRLFRRRHAARFSAKRRMPDRFDRASRGASFPARANPAARARAMASVDEYLVSATTGWCCFSRRRSTKAQLESRLHQRLSSGRARKRRAIHARGDLDDDGLCDARRRRQSGRTFRICSIRSTTPRRAQDCTNTKSNRMSWRRDVYARSAHVGRGGWTWYTGSAGWMYRAALESMLGFHLTR